jgi:hypothetical protein
MSDMSILLSDVHDCTFLHVFSNSCQHLLQYKSMHYATRSTLHNHNFNTSKYISSLPLVDWT